MSDSTSQTPRWVPLVAVSLSAIGTTIVLGGLLFGMGGWRTDVDQRLDTLKARVDVVEGTQRQNLPDFYGMRRDVQYLAERARREEERDDREPRR